MDRFLKRRVVQNVHFPTFTMAHTHSCMRFKLPASFDINIWSVLQSLNGQSTDLIVDWTQKKAIMWKMYKNCFRMDNAGLTYNLVLFRRNIVLQREWIETELFYFILCEYRRIFSIEFFSADAKALLRGQSKLFQQILIGSAKFHLPLLVCEILRFFSE